MDYTPEQRDIIRRMGEVSAEIDAANAEQRTAHVETGNRILDAANALVAAIEHSNRLGTLQKRYGDLFREFLDTL
jgi:hypothetical protein